MNDSDVAAVTGLIETAAATLMMPRFRSLASGDVREKKPGDFVTVVDEEMEAYLIPRLCEILPGSVAVGEELGARDPASIEAVTGDAPVWIIDPLDGTTNFTKGRDRFACLVALACRGDVVAGWIHAPVRGCTAVARSGQGAWLAGSRLRASPQKDLAAADGRFTIPRRDGPRRNSLMRLSESVRKYAPVTCAGLEYLALAEGRDRVVVFNRLHPWDHAAGTLIVSEAGGLTEMTDTRTPYTLNRRDGPMMVAPNRALMDAAFEVTGTFTGR